MKLHDSTIQQWVLIQLGVMSVGALNMAMQHKLHERRMHHLGLSSKAETAQCIR